MVCSFFGNVDELSADKRNCINDRICILQGVIPVIIWQAVAAGFSIIALGNQKSKEDFTLSIVSLIFAIVLAVVVVLFECLQRS